MSKCDPEILEKAFMIATYNGFSQRAEEPDVLKIPEAFIYRHDFAKALWGEYGHIPEAWYEFKCKKSSGVERTKKFLIASAVSPWQYHLQQMVIADDPIKYLGENLREEE